MQSQEKIRSVLAELKDGLNQRPEQLVSSNPYECVADSAAFTSLLACGTEALPMVIQALRDSEKNGLWEYVLAIAAESLSGTDLRIQGLCWESGKEWLAKWERMEANGAGK